MAVWLLLGGVFGLALLLRSSLFWPWEFKAARMAATSSSLTTPLYGLTFGLSICRSPSAVLYQKSRFIPEISIQERRDGASRKSTARRWWRT